MKNTARLSRFAWIALCGIAIGAVGCRSTESRRLGGAAVPATTQAAAASPCSAADPTQSAVVPAAYFTSDQYQAPGTCNH